jgi:hypothetical protein
LIEQNESWPAILKNEEPASGEKEDGQNSWYQYGIKHPRGVGMGASPEGHVDYQADSEKYMGGIVTYDHALPEKDIAHYEYDFLGTISPPDQQENTKEQMGDENVTETSPPVLDDGFATPNSDSSESEMTDEEYDDEFAGEFIDDPRPYELTASEFKFAVDDIDNPLPTLEPYILAHYSDGNKATVDALVEQGEYNSVLDYIHSKSVTEAVNMRLPVPPHVLAEYPNLKVPLPEVWELTKSEFLDRARSYQKAAECEEEDFMKQVLTGSYHKNAVEKAINSGVEVSDRVAQEYPDLRVNEPNLTM